MLSLIQQISSEPLPELPDWTPLKSFSPFFLNTAVPYTFVTLYLLASYYYEKRRPCAPVEIPQWILLAHNGLLAGYSMISTFSTFWICMLAFAKGYYNGGLNGFLDEFCDTSGEGWMTNGIGAWGYLFYVSKYYEVLDTALILAKGRKAGLLQIYHHAGVILICHAMVRWGTFFIWIPATYNTFIHSIMYVYFGLAVVKMDKMLPKIFKQTLTTMQIMQFIVIGIFGAAYISIFHKDQRCTKTAGGIYAIIFVNVYLVYLTYLFGSFYMKSYYGKKASKSQTKQNGISASEVEAANGLVTEKTPLKQL